jgi:hypothetical protein
MPQVRLATTVPFDRDTTVPIITETPRGLDFEPVPGDVFEIWHHGFWAVKVTSPSSAGSSGRRSR